MDDTKDLTFDQALQELENIVKQLEAGTLSLEESIREFERGVTLGKLCNEKLTSAEQKIQKLTRQPDGTVAKEDMADMSLVQQ